MGFLATVKTAAGLVALRVAALRVAGGSNTNNSLVYDPTEDAYIPGPAPGGGGGGGSDFTTPITVTIADSLDPTVNVLETLTARSVDDPAPGFGAAIEFVLDNDNTPHDEVPAARISVRWIDPSSGSEDSKIVFETRTAGGAFADVMSVANEQNVTFGDGGAVLGPGVPGLCFAIDYRILGRNNIGNWHELLVWDGRFGGNLMTLGPGDVGMVYRTPVRSSGGSHTFKSGTMVCVQIDNVACLVSVPATFNNTGFATNDPLARVGVQMDSNSHVLLPYRMTTTQRDAITADLTSDHAGAEFFNLTLSKKQFWDGSAWQTFAVE